MAERLMDRTVGVWCKPQVLHVGLALTDLQESVSSCVSDAPCYYPFPGWFRQDDFCSKALAIELTLAGVPSLCSQKVLPEARRQSLFSQGGFLKGNTSWHFHS